LTTSHASCFRRPPRYGWHVAVVYFFCRPACFASFLVLFISVQENNVWESGLFDVFAEGFGTCFIATCLPCYQYGLNYEKYSKQTGNKKSACFEQAVKYCLVWGAFQCVSAAGSALYMGGVLSMFSGIQSSPLLYPTPVPIQAIDGAVNTMLAGQSLIWLASVGSFGTLGYCFGAPLRRNVRELYGIPERDSCCGSDLATSVFCSCCSSIQLARHMKKHPLPNKSDN
jgi:Cys-rich protein (TIGR01571 family)